MKRVTHNSITNPVASNTGAPAALEAIAAHELRCREAKDAAYLIWQKAKKDRNEDDDISMRTYNRTLRDYEESVEEWIDLTKALLGYDSKVSPARREGEKVSVDEAREYFRQYWLSIELAIEAYIVQISQAAALCESPEAFHLAHAENIRSAKDGAIDACFRGDSPVLPKWLLIN